MKTRGLKQELNCCENNCFG